VLPRDPNPWLLAFPMPPCMGNVQTTLMPKETPIKYACHDVHPRSPALCCSSCLSCHQHPPSHHTPAAAGQKHQEGDRQAPAALRMRQIRNVGAVKFGG